MSMSGKVIGWTIGISFLILWIFLLGTGAFDTPIYTLGQQVNGGTHSFELVGEDGGLSKFIALIWFLVSLFGVWLIWTNICSPIDGFRVIFSIVLIIWFSLLFSGGCLVDMGDVKFSCNNFEFCKHQFREPRSKLGDHIWCPECKHENRVGLQYIDDWPDEKRYPENYKQESN